jgi:hypothetical protein
VLKVPVSCNDLVNELFSRLESQTLTPENAKITSVKFMNFKMRTAGCVFKVYNCEGTNKINDRNY